MSARARLARDAWITAAVFLLALAVRGALLLAVPVGLAWDGVLYERGARAIASGLGYTTFMFPQRSSDTVATAFYPVGYPAFVGALYAVFGASLRVLQWGGAVVGALGVALGHRLAVRVAPGVAATVAGVALALLPGPVLFASAAMTETLFGTLLVLAVYLLARNEGATRVRELCAAGLVLAAATYVRPQAILLAPLLPLLRPSELAPGARGRLAAAALVSVVALAAVLPWSARNCARLDGCAFVSTNGGSNFAIGAVPRATGRYLPLTASDGCAGVRGEVARDRCWRAVALRSIREHPWRFAKLALEKLDHTLSYEAFPIGYLRESRALELDDARERTLRRAITAPWRALLLLALIALVPLGARRRLSDAGRLAAATCALVLATHLLFFGGDRYHLPLVPLLGALAAGAFRGTWPARVTELRPATRP